ncbi:sigma-70 family RNA polymerase sigma factor [Novosphingobium sp. BL-8H]|uniref:sigma-70 family RNA polymerase sigma factor n=1 Tax=Novosphingobium sp. BL-8H TaxID=3127640 RepID=UPI0037580D5C
MLERLFSLGVAAELPFLLRYAMALSRDETAAEDLVQDTVLRACEARGAFQHGRQLRPWLFSILHNRFISDRRRQNTEREKLRQLADETVEEASDAAVDLADLAAAIERLPDDQHAVLHLIVLDGFTYREAAEVLSVPVGTVMSRLSRARAFLRKDEGAERRLHVVGGSYVQRS